MDLEAAAAIIDVYLSLWLERAIDVDSVARSHTHNRGTLDVVGVSLSRGRARGRVTLFGGGWADFEFDCGGHAEQILEIHCLSNERLARSIEMLLSRMTSHFDHQLDNDVVSTNY